MQAGFEARDRHDLAPLFVWLERAGVRAGLDADVLFDLRLALEEVFLNIYKHGYAGGTGRCLIGWQAWPDRVELTLADDAPWFDPSQAPAPPLQADWRQRVPGGLGWHLVRQVVDECRHVARYPRGNLFTLIKCRKTGT